VLNQETRATDVQNTMLVGKQSLPGTEISITIFNEDTNLTVIKPIGTCESLAWTSVMLGNHLISLIFGDKRMSGKNKN
jgi:hypothetical protein